MNLAISLKNKKKLALISLIAFNQIILSFVLFPLRFTLNLNFLFYFYCFMAGILCFNTFQSKWYNTLFITLISGLVGVMSRVIVEWGEVTITENFSFGHIVSTIGMTTAGIFIVYLLMILFRKE
ncbi:hypothetical protein ACSBO6_09640 [Bacillus sp. AL-1R]